MQNILDGSACRNMAAIAEAVVIHPDRNPKIERQGFINGLHALFSAMKDAGQPVHPFYASMLNRLCQDDEQNAYPHFDQAFTKPSDQLGERDKRSYMERMRILVPVALISTLQKMELTVAQAVNMVAKALTDAGYRWPSDAVPAKALSNWHRDASRKTKKVDKVEQLTRAMQIVAEEHTNVCASETRQAYQRHMLIERVAARVAAF